jgi:predicted transcriptional regulator
MTRTYAAEKLLAHGPLSYAELKEITGWGHSTIHFVLNRLIDSAKVRRTSVPGMHGYLYGLAA